MSHKYWLYRVKAKYSSRGINCWDVFYDVWDGLTRVAATGELTSSTYRVGHALTPPVIPPFPNIEYASEKSEQVQKEIAWLIVKAINDREHLVDKIAHGCADFPCEDCDSTYESVPEGKDG